MSFASLGQSPQHAKSFMSKTQSSGRRSYPVEFRFKAISGERNLRAFGRAGRRRSSQINCRREKSEKWPPAVLQIDVGGRIFWIRRENLEHRATTRLGRIAYFLSRLASRQRNREILKPIEELERKDKTNATRDTSQQTPVISVSGEITVYFE